MATTRKVPTTPVETITGFGEELNALERGLKPEEQKNQALLDFKYLHSKLEYAANPALWMVQRGPALLQAKATGDKYFAGVNLQPTVPTDLTTLKALNVYGNYANSWSNVPTTARPAGTPDYAERAKNVALFLKANDFEARCQAEAGSEIKQERRLSR